MVLITGAAMGIGREIAKILAKRGCSLVLWDIQKSLIDELAAELQSQNPSIRIIVVHCDLANRDSIREAINQTKVAGNVDILINNAGIVSGKHLVDLSPEEIAKTMAINFHGTCSTIQGFLPDMIARKSGHIVNVSSLMGLMWGTALTDYCASKFALVGFTHCLRMELKKLSAGNVTCSLICPFAINTGMFEGMQTNFQWLFPVLDATHVADRIVTATEYREEMVVIPTVIYWINSLLPVLPLWLQDYIADTCGGMHGMDEFVGRKTN
jgi:all-trans-retinol dehydrogenase (NAD+)